MFYGALPNLINYKMFSPSLVALLSRNCVSLPAPLSDVHVCNHKHFDYDRVLVIEPDVSQYIHGIRDADTRAGH